MTPEQKLASLGITLPTPPSPGGNYVSSKQAGDVVYLSGVISTGPSGIITGTAGAGSTIDDGYAAAVRPHADRATTDEADKASPLLSNSRREILGIKVLF